MPLHTLISYSSTTTLGPSIYRSAADAVGLAVAVAGIGAPRAGPVPAFVAGVDRVEGVDALLLTLAHGAVAAGIGTYTGAVALSAVPGAALVAAGQADSEDLGLAGLAVRRRAAAGISAARRGNVGIANRRRLTP